MKIMLFGDVHWGSYSSIVRSRGVVFSTRLENLIQCMDWVEALATEHKCERVYGLGDFFDKPTLTAEEITALKQIDWAENIPHYFIVGNHEVGLDSSSFDSARIFDLHENFHVVNYSTLERLTDNKTTLVCIPYRSTWDSLDNDIKSILEEPRKRGDRLIVLSHNDIKGVQMGRMVSNTGISMEYLHDNVYLTVNGHYHNGETINDNIINIGNLSGQNFSEDADVYCHRVFILDTDTIELEQFINPYALNFYKKDLRKELDICLKTNYNVLAIQANLRDSNIIEELIKQLSPVAYKVNYVHDFQKELPATAVEVLIDKDYKEQFAEYMMAIDNSSIVKDELAVILK